MTLPADDLTCRELVEIITDYLEGALPETARERFDAHLQGCEGCRRYLHQMQTTIQITGTLTEERIEPATRIELLQLFRDWNRASMGGG